MLKLPLLALSLYLPVHDDQHRSDWIRDKELRDPITRHQCCGLNDCKALTFGAVKETPAGYWLVERREMVASSRVIWRSPDGQWWICIKYFLGPDLSLFDDGIRCLIGPPPNS